MTDEEFERRENIKSDLAEERRNANKTYCESCHTFKVPFADYICEDCQDYVKSRLKKFMKQFNRDELAYLDELIGDCQISEFADERKYEILEEIEERFNHGAV